MFFQQAFKGLNHWWRYIAVTVIVFIGYQIGTIPLLLALWRAIDNDPALDKDDIQTFMAEPNFEMFGMNTNLGLSLMLLLFVAALAVFFFVFTPFHKREFITLSTSGRRFNWGKVFFAFGVWLCLGLCAEGFNYFMSPDDYSWNFKFNTFIPLLLISIFILPLQTSFEELFFRGYLMQWIGITRLKNILVVLGCGVITFFIRGQLAESITQALNSQSESQLANASLSAMLLNLIAMLIFLALSFVAFKVMKNQSAAGSRTRNYKFVPLILTSIMFGLVHSANPEVEKFGFGIMQFYYISAGLLLGIMTIMDDGLELALGTHAATNFIGAVFVGYDGAAINTDSLFTSHALNAQLMSIVFVVLAILFLLILKSKYKWPSFSKLIDPIEKPNEDLALDKFLSTPTS